jgi:peptidoglycan/xylan/chitin deacetylase (PgdA/CDA1 family)
MRMLSIIANYFSVIAFFCFMGLSGTIYAGEEETLSTSDTKKINEQCDKGTTSVPPPIPSFTWQHTGLITIWFDDGWLSEFTEALPLMEKFGFKGAVAIAVNFVCYSAFMTWDELRDLQNLGWETTAHSVSHNCNLDYYTTETIQHELLDSKKIITAHGLRADQFVMPCGYSRAQIADHFVDKYPPIVEMSKRYYSSYRTTASTRNNTLPLLDAYNLNAFQLRSTTTDKDIQDKINQAIKNKEWLIFVFHQVDDSGRPFAVSPAKFEKILEIIKQSKLPVILPSQIIPTNKSQQN